MHLNYSKRTVNSCDLAFDTQLKGKLKSKAFKGIFIRDMNRKGEGQIELLSGKYIPQKYVSGLMGGSNSLRTIHEVITY